MSKYAIVLSKTRITSWKYLRLFFKIEMRYHENVGHGYAHMAMEKRCLLKLIL